MSIETEYTAPKVTGHEAMEAKATYYTTAVDMQFLGCLVHWLLTLELSLSRREVLPYCMKRISFPKKTLKAHQISTEAVDFLSSSLRPQPLTRLTALERWIIHELLCNIRSGDLS